MSSTRRNRSVEMSGGSNDNDRHTPSSRRGGGGGLRAGGYLVLGAAAVLTIGFTLKNSVSGPVSPTAATLNAPPLKMPMAVPSRSIAIPSAPQGGWKLDSQSSAKPEPLPELSLGARDGIKMGKDGMAIDLPDWANKDSIERQGIGSRFSSSDHQRVMYSSSQMEEEELAYWYFFYRRGGGLFLEMGGLDGTLFSNTIFFERMLGWKGVLIEAKTDFYQRLRVSRKGQVTANAAVCEKPITVHLAMGTKDGPGGIIEFMDQQHIRQWMPEIVKQTKDLTDFSSLPEVPCAPLNAVMNKAGISRLNWLILDVEGGEYSVLKGVNFEVLTVDVICVESTVSEGQAEKNENVKNLLTSKGFVRYGRWRMNEWYVRKGAEISYFGRGGEAVTAVQGDEPLLLFPVFKGQPLPTPVPR